MIPRIIWHQKSPGGPWRFDGWWFEFRGIPYRVRGWRVYPWRAEI